MLTYGALVIHLPESQILIFVACLKTVQSQCWYLKDPVKDWGFCSVAHSCIYLCDSESVCMWVYECFSTKSPNSSPSWMAQPQPHPCTLQSYHLTGWKPTLPYQNSAHPAEVAVNPPAGLLVRWVAPVKNLTSSSFCLCALFCLISHSWVLSSHPGLSELLMCIHKLSTQAPKMQQAPQIWETQGMGFTNAGKCRTWYAQRIKPVKNSKGSPS